MNDISYEILDLFKKYGSDPEGIQKILENDSRPEVLYALSDVRKNLFDWMELKKCEMYCSWIPAMGFSPDCLQSAAPM